MLANTNGRLESHASVDGADTNITGPHYARDGAETYAYYRCEGCGLETTDESIRHGCWQCKGGR